MSDPYSADGGLLAATQPGDNAPAQSVSELSGRLKRTVEDAFGHVRVRGEVSGFKRHSSGHCYFTLKDDKACMDAVIWKGSAGALRFRPEDGIEVVATGRLTTYPGRSKYQIVVDRLELAGQGALMALLDKRRRQLAAEGLFDEGAKRPLPFLPRVIGVVTSPTGAVIRDILHRLADRCPSRVIVWPVPVQGEGAADKVAAAVAGFDAMAGADRPDLVIVARGGGSIEDLWAFNEEVVVRALAACRIPTISAVGHETDTSLADFAADVRAPTPTAAAEMAVPVRSELLARLDQLGHRALRCATRTRERAGERLAASAERLPAADALLGPQRQRADELADRLPRALGARIGHARADLNHAAGALRPPLLAAQLRRAGERLRAVRLAPALVERRVAEGARALAALWRIAEAADPRKPLEKGYVRVENRAGRTLVSAGAARAAGRLRLHFGDGPVDATVDGLERPRRGAYVAPVQPSLL